MEKEKIQNIFDVSVNASAGVLIADKALKNIYSQNKEKVIARIKNLQRTRRDLITQDELAVALHVTRPYINSVLNGKKAPSPDLLKDIAALFNVSIFYLLCIEEEISTQEEKAARTREEQLYKYLLSMGIEIDGNRAFIRDLYYNKHYIPLTAFELLQRQISRIAEGLIEETFTNGYAAFDYTEKTD